MPQRQARMQTRDRILDAAETLFAQKGYSAVKVRDITQSAQSNLAAVNYHFKSKKNLYLEVFKSRWIPRAKRVQGTFWNTLGTDQPTSPGPIVHALAIASFESLQDDEERYRHHQLMARELAQPSEAFELIVDQIMQPFFARLTNLFKPIMNPDMTDQDLLLNLLSIFGMVLYFNFARKAVMTILNRDYECDFKAELSRHLVKFTLHGLEGYDGGGKS